MVVVLAVVEVVVGIVVVIAAMVVADVALTARATENQRCMYASGKKNETYV